MSEIEKDVKPPERRRAHRRLVVGLVGLAALVLVAGVTGTVLAWRYEPVLRSDGMSVQPIGTPVDQGHGRPSLVRVVYMDGGDLAFAFTVRNQGRFAVAINAVELSADVHALIRETSVEMTGPGEPISGRVAGPADHDLLRPFAAFGLDPHEARILVVRATLGNCEFTGAGGTSAIGSVRLDVSALGFAHVVDFGLPEEVGTVSPSDTNCPRPRNL